VLSVLVPRVMGELASKREYRTKPVCRFLGFGIGRPLRVRGYRLHQIRMPNFLPPPDFGRLDMAHCCFE
jgi:hypothetical protein